MLKKGRFYLLITFITARIEYAIALAGLPLRRKQPDPVVKSVRIDSKLEHHGRWVMNSTESNYLYYSAEKQQAVILRLPKYTEN